MKPGICSLIYAAGNGYFIPAFHGAQADDLDAEGRRSFVGHCPVHYDGDVSGLPDLRFSGEATCCSTRASSAATWYESGFFAGDGDPGPPLACTGKRGAITTTPRMPMKELPWPGNVDRAGRMRTTILLLGKRASPM